jgi:hypothetical protein
LPGRRGHCPAAARARVCTAGVFIIAAGALLFVQADTVKRGGISGSDEVTVRQFPDELGIGSGHHGQFLAVVRGRVLTAGVFIIVAGALLPDEVGLYECTGSGTRAGEANVRQFLSDEGRRPDPSCVRVPKDIAYTRFPLLEPWTLLLDLYSWFKLTLAKVWALALCERRRDARPFVTSWSR